MFRHRLSWRASPIVLLLGLLLSASPALAQPKTPEGSSPAVATLQSEISQVFRWLWSGVFGAPDLAITPASAPAEGDEGPGMTPDG